MQTKEQDSRNRDNADDGDDDDDDDDFEAVFAAELAKEMEKMLGGLKTSSDNVNIKGYSSKATSNTDKTEDPEQESEERSNETIEEKQFRETFEKILADSLKGGDGEKLGGLGSDGVGDDMGLKELGKLMQGLGASGVPGPSTTPMATKPKASSQKQSAPQSFEDTVKATMSRLSDSEAGHKSRDANANNPNDPMATLMAQMEALGGGIGGLPGLDSKEGDADLPDLLDGLMDQLMSKELLYEPISELKTKVCAS